MASFSRNLIESVSFSDFLNAGGNLGFGVYSFSPIINSGAFGVYSQQRIAQSEAIGGEAGPHMVSRFVPEGKDPEVQANLFDPEGKDAEVQGLFYEPEGKDQGTTWGIDFARPISETITIADMVDTDGAFIRNILEDHPMQDRCGASKGVFFRSTPSGIVTGNPQVRRFEDLPGTGQIASSRRLSTDPLKVFRFVPGTTPAVPNQVNLGAVPATPGSQGWILDASPQGVLLNGSWEINVVLFDATGSGTVRIHGNLFVVTATPTGVSQVIKIGITKATAPISLSVVPTEYTLNWSYGEAGEAFVGLNQFIYVELFLEEITHPVPASSVSTMRLDDQPHTFFSRMRYPGVAASATFTRTLSETMTFLDTVARILGHGRNIAEMISISDILTLNVGLARELVESLSINDQVSAAKNALLENITITDILTTQQVLTRQLTETISILDILELHGNFEINLVENITIQDQLTGYVIHPPGDPRTDKINKRPLDEIKRETLRTFRRST